MTTVYVNRRLGVVLTDRRTTYTNVVTILGIPVKTKDTFFDYSHKAMYLHDRIFTVSGDVCESDKVLRYLTTGKPIVPYPKNYKTCCNCLLIDRNWVIQFLIHKGKFIRKFMVLPENWSYCTGSGSDALTNALDAYNEPSLEEVITSFETVKFSDKYSNDLINIYHF